MSRYDNVAEMPEQDREELDSLLTRLAQVRSVVERDFREAHNQREEAVSILHQIDELVPVIRVLVGDGASLYIPDRTTDKWVVFRWIDGYEGPFGDIVAVPEQYGKRMIALAKAWKRVWRGA